MNKDFTALSIKRSIHSKLREIAAKHQRTPQGMIAYWCSKEEVDLATLEKILNERLDG